MTSWLDSQGRCGKPGRFLAPIQISRAAGDLAILLGLPGLLNMARLLIQFSCGDPNTTYLFLGAMAKARAGCSGRGAPAPALPALTAVPRCLGIPLSAIPPSTPDSLQAGTAGHSPGDPRTPHQPELLVSQKGDVEALTQRCFSSALGGSLSCRGHLGCRGGSVPQSGTPWGCRLWGAVSFQTYAGPETNLPSNLLLTETKCSTESASGDPKPRLILEALLSPSLQPCGPALAGARLPLPSDTELCSPWTADQGLSEGRRALTPFSAGLDEIPTRMKAALCPHFPEKGRAVREGKDCGTL